jgi:hypothetical protein
MGAVLPVIVIGLGLVLPMGLLVWSLMTGAKSRVYLGSILVLTAIVIGVLPQFIFGFWHVIGVFWPVVYLLAFAAILVFRVLRGLPTKWLPKGWSWETFLAGLNVAHAALWALLIPPLLQARSHEGQALSLSSPLRGGPFYVVSGGGNGSVNQHSDYAMDIAKLNAFGFSAAGFYPAELEKHAAFGAEIIAPCAGEVIAAENSKLNRRPLDPDSNDLRGGNHVVIFCDGHSVHLAHMQPGSIVVGVGDQVAAGQLLGKVGNSGNTMQPHLHINAVRGRHILERGKDGAPAGAEPAPFLIDGKFLIKGDSFSS